MRLFSHFGICFIVVFTLLFDHDDPRGALSIICPQNESFEKPRTRIPDSTPNYRQLVDHIMSLEDIPGSKAFSWT